MSPNRIKTWGPFFYLTIPRRSRITILSFIHNHGEALKVEFTRKGTRHIIGIEWI